MSRTITFIDAEVNPDKPITQQNFFNKALKTLIENLLKKNNVTANDINSFFDDINNKCINKLNKYPLAKADPSQFKKTVNDCACEIFEQWVTKTFNEVNTNPENIDQLFTDMKNKIDNLSNACTRASPAIVINPPLLFHIQYFIRNISTIIKQKIEEFSCNMIENFPQLSTDERKNLLDQLLEKVKLLLTFFLKQHNTFHGETIDNKVYHCTAAAANSFFEKAMEQEIKKISDFTMNINESVENVSMLTNQVQGNIDYLLNVFCDLFPNYYTSENCNRLRASFFHSIEQYTSKFAASKEKIRLLDELESILKGLCGYIPSEKDCDYSLLNQTINQVNQMKNIVSTLINCTRENKELLRLTFFIPPENPVLLDYWKRMGELREQINSLPDTIVNQPNADRIPGM